MKSLISRLSRSPSPRSAAGFFARRPAAVAVVALAVFAVAAAAALDDYGVWVDETDQREIGYASFDYILGDEDALIEGHHNRLYGVAFELPLIAVERLLGLEDSRAVYLSRRMVSHMFFLAGGFFAWMLAYRLFGSRAIALLAMLLFLLHPRIYAHSFFNTKDLPFLSMFMLSLYLTHRAFRRDTAWAFALCGVSVGLLVNIRIMGVMMIPAVLGMLALDAFYAMKRGGGGGEKRILANICAFSTICAATLYAAWPLLWRDPLNFAEAFAVLSNHPTLAPMLFRGEWVVWPNIPWDYIPTWILITTPPVALVLAALGMAYLARLCAARRRDALADPTARFGLLAVSCLILPVAGVIALNSNLYGGWRQMYFIYAPICVLAAFGLRGAAALFPKRAHRIGVYATVVAALGVVVIQMVSLHPYQNDYFNLIVNRNGAERMANRYEMGYVHVSRREALEFLLDAYPERNIAVYGVEAPHSFVYLEANLLILSKEERERVTVNGVFPDFWIDTAADVPVWTREVYGVPIASVADVRVASEAAHRAKREYARAAEPLASGGGFDVYTGVDDGGDNALLYVKDACTDADTRGRFFVRAFPVRQDSLREESRALGRDYDEFGFDFAEYGARYGGACVIESWLPRYPIRAIETGQARADGSVAWSAAFALDLHRDAYAATRSAKPAVESDFDIYLDGRTLTYVKERCTDADTRGRFQLWAFPDDAGDLSEKSRRGGLAFNSLNFGFERYGATLDGGKCVIARTLPSYPITHVDMGQWTEAEGTLWSARITFAAGIERHRRTAAALARERAAIESDFNVHLVEGALVYIKDPCGVDDTRGRFFLSVFPKDESDLSDESRALGRDHDALNFDFARYGALFDGKCVIMRDLPGYPLSRVETGQWIPGGERLWDGEIVVGD